MTVRGDSIMSFTNNPKKTSRILLVAAIVIFFIGLLHNFGGDAAANTATWVSSRITPLGRPSLKEHMRKAEASWMRYVQMRNAWISTKGGIDKMTMTTTGLPGVWDFFLPAFACPYEMDRIGDMGDGGKWTCGMHKYEALERPCVIYSFGVNTESSFENEFLTRTNCEVWGYDYSVGEFGPQLTTVNRQRSHFNKIGISNETDTARDPPFYSIIDLMTLNGHDHIDIMKMDIEGAEFGSMEAAINHFLEAGKEFPVSQFMVEIHVPAPNSGGTPTFKQFVSWWETIESSGMRPIFAEPNMYSAYQGGVLANEYVWINTRDSRSPLFPSSRK